MTAISFALLLLLSAGTVPAMAGGLSFEDDESELNQIDREQLIALGLIAPSFDQELRDRPPRPGMYAAPRTPGLDQRSKAQSKTERETKPPSSNVTVSDDASGATVVAEAPALQRDYIALRDRTPDTDHPLRAGPVVEITSATRLERATVTLPIKEQTPPGPNSTRSIYTWKPGSGGMPTPVETTVDRTNDTATAELSSAGTVALLWQPTEQVPDSVSPAISQGQSDDRTTAGKSDERSTPQPTDVRRIPEANITITPIETTVRAGEPIIVEVTANQSKEVTFETTTFGVLAASFETRRTVTVPAGTSDVELSGQPPGEYLVEAQTGENNQRKAFSDPITVEPGTPTISTNDTTPTAGDKLSFSIAPATLEPNDSIVETGWAFGDGTTASGRTPAHTYEQPGTYTVTATASIEWDGSQFERTAMQTLTVSPADGENSTDEQQFSKVPDSWTVRFVDDPEEASNVSSAKRPADVAGLIDTNVVSPNASVNDTDGDGLSDYQEFLYRTDPTSADTSGDGISDKQAVEAGLDPTLHDYQSPEINVTAVDVQFQYDIDPRLRERLAEYGTYTAAQLERFASYSTAQVDAIMAWSEQQFQAFLSYTTGQLAALAELTADQLSALGAWSLTQLEALGNWTSDQLGALASFGTEQLSALADWSQETFAGLREWSSQRLSALGSFGTQALDALDEWSQDSIAALQSWSTDKVALIGSWSTAKLDALGEFSTDRLTALGSWTWERLFVLEDWTDDQLAQLQYWAETIIETLGGLEKQTIETFGTFSAQQLYEFVVWDSAELGALQDWTTDQIATLTALSADQLSDLSAWGRQKLLELGTWTEQELSELVGWSRAQFGRFGALAYQQIEKIGEWSVDKLQALGNWTDQQLEALGAWGTEQLGAVTDWTTTELERFADWSKRELSALGDWGDQQLNALIDVGGAAMDAIQAWGRAGIDALGDWTDDQIDELFWYDTGTLEAMAAWDGSQLTGLGELDPDALFEIGVSWSQTQITAIDQWGRFQIAALAELSQEQLGELGRWDEELTALSGWASTKIEALGDLTENRLAKLYDWSTTELSTLGQWTDDQISKLRDWSPSDIAELGEQGVSTIQDAVGGGIEAVGDGIDDLLGWISSAAAARQSSSTATESRQERSENKPAATTGKTGTPPESNTTTSQLTPEPAPAIPDLEPVTVEAPNRSALVANDSESPHTATDNVTATATASGPQPASGSIDPFASVYTTTFDVKDPSGVEAVVLQKAGQTKTISPEEMTRISSGEDTWFRTTATLEIDSALTGALEGALIGERLTFVARDVHGNEGTKQHYDSNFYAEAAKYLDERSDQNINQEQLEEELQTFGISPMVIAALLSGFTHAAGTTVQGLLELLENPEQLLAFIELAKAIWEDYTVIADIAKQGVNAVAEAQDNHNPFEKTDELQTVLDGDGWEDNPYEALNTDYARFAAGWYTGYLGGFVIEAVVGTKGVAKAKQSLSAYSQTANRVFKAYDSGKAVLVSKSLDVPKQTSIRTAKYIADRTPVDIDRVRRGLDGAPTTVQHRVATTMTDRLDSSTLQAIKQAGLESQAVRYLAGTKADGYKLLNRLDQETAKDFLGLACGKRSRSFVAANSGGNCGPDEGFASEDLPSRLGRMQNSDQITTDQVKEFEDTYNSLNEEFKQNVDNLIEESGKISGNGGIEVVELAAESNPQDIYRILGTAKGSSGLDELAGLIKQSDGSHTELLNDISGSKLGELLQFSDVEQRRLVNIAYKTKIGDNPKLVSSDLQGKPDEVMDILDYDNRINSIKDIRAIAVDSDSDAVRYLGPGVDRTGESGVSYGFNHIDKRHISGSAVKSDAPNTGFFPLGQKIEAPRNGRTPETPETDLTEADVAVLIRQTIDNADKIEEGAKIYTRRFDNPQSGIEQIKVVTGKNGRVKTAYPIKGENVIRYTRDNKNEWQRWDDEKEEWKKLPTENSGGRSTQSLFRPSYATAGT